MSDERTSAVVYGSSAYVCRELGWYAGTVIQAAIPHITVLRITAVGEQFILAREVVNEDGQVYERDEMLWILSEREWRRIDDATDPSTEV